MVLTGYAVRRIYRRQRIMSQRVVMERQLLRDAAPTAQTAIPAPRTGTQQAR